MSPCLYPGSPCHLRAKTQRKRRPRRLIPTIERGRRSRPARRYNKTKKNQSHPCKGCAVQSDYKQNNGSNASRMCARASPRGSKCHRGCKSASADGAKATKGLGWIAAIFEPNVLHGFVCLHASQEPEHVYVLTHVACGFASAPTRSHMTQRNADFLCCVSQHRSTCPTGLLTVRVHLADRDCIYGARTVAPRTLSSNGHGRGPFRTPKSLCLAPQTIGAM